MVQQTPEAVVAARQEPAKVPQGPARALVELQEAQPPPAVVRLVEVLELQVPGSALLWAETRGLPAQGAPARLTPDGFPLQAPSVPA